MISEFGSKMVSVFLVIIIYPNQSFNQSINQPINQSIMKFTRYYNRTINLRHIYASKM